MIAVFLVYALRRVPAGEPVGVPSLSVRDRWSAVVVIGGCVLLGAAQRASRWWDEWGSSARPWELIPTLCFGVGAGLVLGVLLYAVGVRVWRPAARDVAGRPEELSAERSRPGAH